MRILARIGAIYLLVLAGFVWGLMVPVLKIFPYSQLKALQSDVTAFMAGGDNEDTSFAGKLLNDTGVRPERMIRQFTPQTPSRFKQISLARTRDRRDAPRVFLAPDAPRVHRVIVGAFDFKDTFWGAVLLNPEGEIIHQWSFDGEIEGYAELLDVQKNLYGIAFLPDGAAIYNMQHKLTGLVKVDRCSRREWIAPGLFHHAVQPTDDQSAVWTLGGHVLDLHPKLVLIDVETGKMLRTIDMADVERANPDRFIFDLRGRDFGDKSDPTHANDIEALPTNLAAAFPMFEAGDLMLSYRTTNHILVVDPDTLQVKWSTIGQTEMQHDPDWNPDGTISVFSNGHRGFGTRQPPFHSDIVTLDPFSGERRVILNGSDHDFFSFINGRHTLTPNGILSVTSSTQGRVFEVDPDTGEIVFEFINAYDWDEGRTLHLSEAFIVDAATAERWTTGDCEGFADRGGQG